MLGDLETAVMEVLWARPEDALSVRDVHVALSRSRDLAYTTVMTVLDRLSKKGIVDRRLDGRAWLYRPAQSRADLVVAEIGDLLAWLSPEDRAEVLAQLT